MLIACDNVEKLLCVEIRRKGLPRGLKWPMYEIARATSDEPLILAAARVLDRPPARIGLVSGAAVPDHMPLGENDGPFGTAVLARALHALGHQIRVYTDPACVPPIAYLLEHYDVPAEITGVAVGDDVAPLAETADVFVAIERLGGNVNGHLYGVTGFSRDPFRANFDALFGRARALRKPTIGIGDGGNEIGFGKIHGELSERMPEYASRDRTACGGGILSVVETDVLVVASTSNLGAYGVVAALALLRGDAGLCHTPQEEFALHHVGVGLGLVDGGTGARIAACDGIAADTNAAMVRLVEAIVTQSLLADRRRGF